VARVVHPGGVSRRRFLRQSIAASVIGAAGLPRVFREWAEAVEPKAPARSKVVEATNPAWKRDGKVDPEAVRRTLERGLMEFTGKPSVADAWRQFASPSETIGVKFNDISQNFSGANQALGDAIIDGLLQAGLQREKIILVEAVGASFPGTGQADRTLGPEFDTGHGKTRHTRFLREQIDGIINVPDLKEHDRAGVTLAVKNLSHGRSFIPNPGSFHSNYCDPHVGELHSQKLILTKRRLNILNGLRGIFHLGPSPGAARWQWDRNSLFFSTDPVAMDAIGLDITQEKRRTAPDGIQVVDLFQTNRRPVFLATCVEMGLGIGDLKRIDWVRVQV